MVGGGGRWLHFHLQPFLQCKWLLLLLLLLLLRLLLHLLLLFRLRLLAGLW